MARAPQPPHRVTFLAPVLSLPAGKEALEQPAALLLYITFFEHLVRHPRVSVTDPDDHRLTDGDDRLMTVQHPNIERIKGVEFGTGRRDEVVWFELSLDPTRPAPVKLRTESYDGRQREFAAIGSSDGSTLGAQIETCIGQWLSALEVPPAPARLEPFTADDFLNAVACGFDSIRSRTADGGVELTVPPRLQLPFYRFVYVVCNLYTWQQILALDPTNPWAKRDKFLAQLHQQPPVREINLIREAIAAAPCFGKPHLSMFGEGVTDDEKVNGFATASMLIPANGFALKDYGYALNGMGRWAEASRYAERACRASPLLIEAHLLSMDVTDVCRYGAQYRNAQQHMGFLQSLVERQVLNADDPDLRHMRLRYADMLMRVGRFDEAIEARAAALEGIGASWPNQTKVLEKWRTDPSMFATLYAREAALRGDPGRVVQGFSASMADSASEVGMLVEALIALGQEDLAALCFAQHSALNFGINPVSRLAGARAYAMVGKTAEAIECVTKVSLGFPHLDWDTAVNRVLRLLATHPAAAWEQVVEGYLLRGANRLARLVARDAADFVPGLAQSRPVTHALAGGQPFGYDPSIFGALRAVLDEYGLDAIDQLFAQYQEPSLAHADRLVNEFPAVLGPEPSSGAPQGAWLARAAKVLWGFASAYGRYLALSTQPPNVLAGGYRQVASDALEMLRQLQGILPRKVVRALLEGLERVAGAVEPWLFDAWLLRIERALDLEANECGHLLPLVEGLPWMSWLLRGDERISLEYKLAQDAQADPKRAQEALALFERSVRAIGRGAAPKWSASAVNLLPPDQAIDVHFTATLAHGGFAGPCIEAAKIALPAGRGAAAFDGLCSNLPGAGKQWREKQVAALAPLWAQGRMPCPHDFTQASQVGAQALQQGNFQLAIDCHRWMGAQEPNNNVVWKNLGIAYARLGKVHDALAAFSRADRSEAPKWTAIALRDAKFGKEATLVYRYASLWFGMADDWQHYANVAAGADESEDAAVAYGKVLAMNPAAATPNFLHQYADSLNEMGDYAKGAEVAQQLLRVAQGDATYTTCGQYHLGHALVGLGRFQEALPWAQQALAQNKYPENREPYSDKVARAQQGRPLEPKPSRFATPEARAWALVREGDFKAVLALGEGPSGAAPGGWKLERAVLAASEFRYESENEVSVTARARETAGKLLAATAGQTDVHAVAARAHALRIRENDLFPVDPPCVMGRRVPREEFVRLFSQRTTGSGMAFTPASADTDLDALVFPGQKVAKLSDYVRIMKGMQAGNVAGALQAAGLDMASYGQAATAWGQRIAADPTLAEKFRRMMHG